MRGILSGQRRFSQPGVATNTQFKRSTSFTPFQLMFGRNCDPFGFLKLVNGSLEDIFEGDVSDDGKLVIVNTFAVVLISKVRLIIKLLFID